MSRRLLFVLFCSFLPAFVTAQDDKAPASDKPQDVIVDDGGLTFQVPSTWAQVQPKINMIEAEFAIPKLESDPANGRVTVMSSGGTIEQNIDRWKSQFEDAEDDAIKVSAKDVGKLKVHVVDITGTYLDTMGNPAGPKSKRENYRLLGAIIESPNGNYYVKCYGPAPTMEHHHAGFQKLVDSVRAVQ